MAMAVFGENLIYKISLWPDLTWGLSSADP